MALPLYHCPDCCWPHEEPGDAAYALLVICTSCALERELREAPRPAS